MKHIYLIIIITTILLSSCSKLDSFLGTAPSSDLSYIENLEDCEKLLNNPNLIGAINYTYFLDDCIDFDDFEAFSPIGTPDYREFTFWTKDKMIVLETEDDKAWNKLYNNIYYSNVILKEIDNIQANDENLKSNIKGEAYLARAFYHFILVNLYGKHYNAATATSDLGVPIALNTNLKELKSRKTVAEVYEQIESDLKNSVKFLNKKNVESGKNYRGSIAGAHALMAKVCFYKQDWTNAIINANLSLELNSHITDYNNFPTYNDYKASSSYSSINNPETTYLKGTADPLNGLFAAQTTSPTMGALFGGLHLTDVILSKVDTQNDLRYKLFMGENMFGNITLKDNRTYDSQYYGYINCGTSTWETTLILAESYARNNKIAEAKNALNTLLQKRYKSDTFEKFNSADVREIIDRIQHEKNMESVYTCNRWFEMRRLFVLGEYNTTIIRKNGNGEEIGRMVPSANRMVLPISIKLQQINPNIKANPFE